jgi:pimeloyl-ACP methyl ester carboxylesterase
MAVLIALIECAGLLVSGCAVTSPDSRRGNALNLAAAAGWQASKLKAGRFTLLALHPLPPAPLSPSTASRPAKELAIFIEGDGLAWLNTTTPSLDPTPRNPAGLRMALAETRRTAVYLARPCQYTASPEAERCTVKDWTAARFSLEMVTAMDQAVSQLKQAFGAERLVLVGYSGGGAIAALLAARRTDVSRLVTVAAVLDTAAWTQQQGVSPLDASLNPADEWRSLRGLPQLHFVGGQDNQTGRAAVQPFVDRFARSQSPSVIRVVEEPAFTHACCWAEEWPRLSPP